MNKQTNETKLIERILASKSEVVKLGVDAGSIAVSVEIAEGQAWSFALDKIPVLDMGGLG